jgi:hypothetical protein
MLIQNAIKVNPVKDQRRADPDAREMWPKILFKGTTLDTQIARSFLTVETALGHGRPRIWRRVTFYLVDTAHNVFLTHTAQAGHTVYVQEGKWLGRAHRPTGRCRE